MNQKQIREHCYACGNRCLLHPKDGGMPTDYCDKAQLDCSQIVFCHPSVRTPKAKQVRHKQAVE